MSNEEIVVRIQSGEQDLMSELWERVERYIMSKASKLDFKLANLQNRSYNSKKVTGVLEQGDFYNTGYLALIKAVETYKPEREAPFIPWLLLHLKTAFSETTGYRTVKGRMEPQKQAISLNKLLGDEADGISFGDLVPDPTAAATMDAIEEKLWQKQLREAMTSVLEELPEEQSAVLRQRYYNQQTLAATGEALGIKPEEVRKLEIQGLRTLRHYKLARKIRPFYDFDYYSGCGLGSFRSSGMSIQERYVTRMEEAGKYRGI